AWREVHRRRAPRHAVDPDGLASVARRGRRRGHESSHRGALDPPDRGGRGADPRLLIRSPPEREPADERPPGTRDRGALPRSVPDDYDPCMGVDREPRAPALLHPIAVAALAVLLLNDHALKG